MNDHIYIYWDDVPLAKPIEKCKPLTYQNFIQENYHKEK
jgi:hypothetical protein